MTKRKPNPNITKIKNKRLASTDIKLRSWKQVERNIHQLALGITGKEYKNKLFLKKKEKVKKWIDNLKNKNGEPVSLSKKRLLYTAILIILSPTKGNAKAMSKVLYKHYSADFYKITQDYKDIQAEQKKTIKQDENWVSWETIKQLQKKLGVIAKQIIKVKKLAKAKGSEQATRQELKAIQDWVIMSLYTLINPRRLDYAKMVILKQSVYNKMTQDEKKSYNYLVLGKKKQMFFSFGKDVQKNKNKNAKGFMIDTFILDVPNDLQKILSLVLKIKQFTVHYKTSTGTDRHLLQDSRGQFIKPDTLSKEVMKITSDNLDKNVSASMLRTIYLSDKHKNDIPTLEKQKTAMEMGHSVSVAESHYTKH